MKPASNVSVPAPPSPQTETHPVPPVSGPSSHSHAPRCSSTRTLVMTAALTAVIAVCAQITVPVQPVPFTLQTLAVCLAGGLAGWKCGTLSVLVYLLLGAVGIPVFSGFQGGIGRLIGPTGGYLIGFLLTALIVGLIADKFGTRLWIMIGAMTAGLLGCYGFGTGWFMMMTNLSSSGIGLGKALSLCVLPFLLFDSLKLVAAALLVNRLKACFRI